MTAERILETLITIWCGEHGQELVHLEIKENKKDDDVRTGNAAS